MKGPKNCQPLWGMSLEKPIEIFLPIFDAFSGLTGLGLLATMVYRYHTIDIDTITSSRKLQVDNFQKVKWSTIAAVALSLFFLAILLRKGGLTKNVTLLNLWVMFTLLQVAILVALTLTSAFSFPETFQLNAAAIIVVYHVVKLYLCHVVRFYALELMHEHKMSLEVRSLTDAEISDFENGTPSLSHHIEGPQVIQNLAQRNGYKRLSEIELSLFELENGLSDIHSPANPSPDDLYELAQYNGYQKHFEIDINCLSIDWNCPLGKGEFAAVFKGHLNDNNYSTDVAVKVIDPNKIDASCFKLMLSEVKVMTYTGEHPNVVRLTGANTSEIKHRNLLIITEFCAWGSLLDKLRVSRGLFKNLVQDGVILQLESETEVSVDNDESISTFDLLRWSHQIAKGMEFLASKRLVHGDLAARNVLLSDQSVAKIADFGLSRQLYEYSVYVKKSRQPLPWRSLAIEAIIDRQFSIESDIWSYGITLWEIFSLGEVDPYPGYLFGNQFIQDMRKGLQPTSPSNAPILIHQIMQTCWNHNPQQRSTFTKIEELLRTYS